MNATCKQRLTRTILLLLTCLAGIGDLSPLRAQTEGIPLFRNYTAKEYQAHNRNFDVVCDSAGIAYFANFEGILYFNGAEWHRLLTPGISRITRLYIDRRGTVWAGGHHFIGRITTEQNGTPILHACLSDVPGNGELPRIGEVTQIEERGDTLWCYTRNYQVALRADSVCEVRPCGSLPVREKVTSQKISVTNQFYLVTNGNDGLTGEDATGRQLFRLTEANGLCSNTINSISSDGRGTVWVATDNGVCRLNIPAFYTQLTANEGLKGEVTAVCRHAGSLYVGTLHGLFRYNRENDRFERLPHIAQSCWQLREAPGGALYAATGNGVFQVKGNETVRINDYNTFSLAFDPNDPNVYYTGEMDGIYRHQGKGEKIASIERAMRLELTGDKLWVETLYGELYQLNLTTRQPQPIDSLKGLAYSEGNRLCRSGKEILALSREGFKRWDERRGSFVSQPSVLDTHLGEQWWPGLYAESAATRAAWVTGGDGKQLVALRLGEIDSTTSRKLNPLRDYTIRTLYFEPNGVAWIGGDFGLIRFNPEARDLAFDRQPEVHIRGIRIGADSLFFGGDNSGAERHQAGSDIRFDSSRKNIAFAYSSTSADIIYPTHYAYYLEGLERQWGPWQSQTRREYTNLSYGNYTFHVKALDAFGRESEVASFSFTILKPFYLKWYCLLLYLLAAVGLILLFFKWRTRQLLKEKTRLERIVEQRTRQIREQRDEIAEKSERLERTLQELREAQAQLIRQEKAATIGKLTRGLIDRILNPLNYIINFSRLSSVLLKDMAEDVEDEKEQLSEDNYEDMQEIMGMLRTHLTKIEEHGNSTSRILKAMEEMLEEHRCQFAATDLNKLIRQNVDLLKEYYKKEIEATGIRIHFEPREALSKVDADPSLLGKVLMSLMQNSLYALRKKWEKEPYPAEMAIHAEQRGDRIRIRLHDNGIGIEAGILDKIFDPFFTTKTSAEAAGVGLYLSREIILSHHGTLEVRSEKDNDTEFFISIPIHQPSKPNNNE